MQPMNGDKEKSDQSKMESVQNITNAPSLPVCLKIELCKDKRSHFDSLFRPDLR